MWERDRSLEAPADLPKFPGRQTQSPPVSPTSRWGTSILVNWVATLSLPRFARNDAEPPSPGAVLPVVCLSGITSLPSVLGASIARAAGPVN